MSKFTCSDIDIKFPELFLCFDEKTVSTERLLRELKFSEEHENYEGCGLIRDELKRRQLGGEIIPFES